MYQILKEKVTLEDVNDLDIPIPDELTDFIDQLLIEPPVETTWRKKREIIEAINKRFNDLLNIIILELIPAPAPAFLTEIISGEAQIELSEKDFLVEVGEPGRNVMIFSQNNTELGKQISDENGIVVFKDFILDKYKIMVEGFEIKEVRHVK